MQINVTKADARSFGDIVRFLVRQCLRWKHGFRGWAREFIRDAFAEAQSTD
jgi:hypothetical protein